MKISRNKSEYNASMVSVQAAKNAGTTYYRIPLDKAVQALKNKKCNLFLAYELQRSGWSAIKIDEFFGSKCIDDTLYFCVTDGQDINVGSQMLDPESALRKIHLEHLKPYIKDADDDFISKHITEYELKMPKGKDLVNCVKMMLNEIDNFDRIYKSYSDVKDL